MNLFIDIFGFLKWALRVLRTFVKRRPVTTMTIIFLSSISRITNTLAFLIPLKVILLASSDEVPRYFQFFISQENRAEWLIGFSLAAILSYVLTLMLEGISGHMADLGSRDIVQGASKIILLRNQQGLVREFYSRYAQMIAGAVFFLTGMVVIAVADLLLMTVLLCLFVFELILTWFFLGFGNASLLTGMRNFIVVKSGGYLNVLFSVNFLLGFCTILYPLLTGGGNVLVAILSIVIMRQAFSSAHSAIVNAIRLSREQTRLEPLIFRGHQLLRREGVDNRVFRDQFEKTRRAAIAEREIRALYGQASDVDSVWQEQPNKGMFAFVLSCLAGKERQRRFLWQRVFLPQSSYMLENEEFLFSKISRQKLKAPQIVSSFFEGSFQCQIFEYGDGRPVSRAQWKDLVPDLLAHYWSVTPSTGIISAYKSAKPTLVDRFNQQLIDRLSIAIDTVKEGLWLSELLDRLGEVKEKMVSLPPHIFNPDLKPSNMVNTRFGDIYVMTWINWAIEPVGVEFSSLLSEERLLQVLEQVNRRRKDLKSPLMPNDIGLAKACWAIEQDINKGKYKLALQAIPKVIACLS